jgi:hypothetical protein
VTKRDTDDKRSYLEVLLLSGCDRHVELLHQVKQRRAAHVVKGAFVEVTVHAEHVNLSKVVRGGDKTRLGKTRQDVVRRARRVTEKHPLKDKL